MARHASAPSRIVKLAALAATALLSASLMSGTGAAAAEDAGSAEDQAVGQSAGAYVALGDSYSSGVGTREYIDDGSQCQRSVLAFPSLVATARGLDLDFRACSGATVADVTSAQLAALSASTTHVTISVGGNDAGFADVLTECALPAWSSDCHGAIDDAQAFIGGSLPASLSTLYDEIRARAPSASVVVVGYPRIFMGEDCNALTWFSPEEQERLNATADQLNATLSSRAASAGFGFADPTAAFTGHAVCDDPEWINGLSNPVSESYHPNAAGQSDGYTPLVSPSLTGVALSATPDVHRQAAATADELAAQQRRHAERDAGIEPKEFVAPDLDSPRVRAAADRHGIDTADRGDVDRADREFAERQAAAR